GARGRDPADAGENPNTYQERLGEPEVTVGTDGQIANASAMAGRGEDRELGDGARRRDPADSARNRGVAAPDDRLGEPEIAVGADRPIAPGPCGDRELGEDARGRDPADSAGFGEPEVAVGTDGELAPAGRGERELGEGA